MASIKQASKASNLTSEHPPMTATCSLFHSSRCPPQQQFFASGKKEEEGGTSAAALVPPSPLAETAAAPHTILASRDVGMIRGSRDDEEGNNGDGNSSTASYDSSKDRVNVNNENGDDNGDDANANGNASWKIGLRAISQKEHCKEPSSSPSSWPISWRELSQYKPKW